MSPNHPIRHRRDYVIAGLIFALSRAGFLLAGIRFDAEKFGHLWQIVDPVLLKERLLESIFHLHTQPPLYNFVLGLQYKLFAAYFPFAMQALYMSLGLAFSLSVYYCLLHSRVGAWVRWIVFTLLIISPPMILYENWILYTYPTAALLCIAGVFLHQYIRSRTFLSLCLAVLLFTAMLMIRNSFHPMWLAMCFAIMIFYCRPLTRRDVKNLLSAASIPLVLLGLLYAKNLILFDNFGTGSQLGLHLARIITEGVPRDEREKLVQSGRISKLALVVPFTGKYPRHYFKKTGRTIAILDDERKSTGAINLHNRAYVEIGRIYRKDALYLARTEPLHYWRRIKLSFRLHFAPSNAYTFLDKNARKIGDLTKFYYKYLHGLSPGLSWHIFLPTLLGFLYGLYVSIAYARRDPARAALAAYLTFNVLYVSAVSILLEFGENNRFRFQMELPAYILFAGFLHGIISRIREGSP